jgi:hypothetical protein
MSSPSHIDPETNEEEQKTTEVQVVPVVANKYSISKKIITQNFSLLCNANSKFLDLVWLNYTNNNNK